MNIRSIRVVGALPCALGLIASHASAQVCGIVQSELRVSIRELPDIRAELSLCLESPMEATLLDQFVQCRMYWRLTDHNPEGQRTCSDFDYLYSTDEDPFAPDDNPSEVCLVRQVTEAQEADGEQGWYYRDSAPETCRNQGPAVTFPLNHPETFEVLLQCGIIKQRSDQGEVIDVFANQCVAPPSAADASDVGKPCSRELDLASNAHQLTFGNGECASEVCLTTPHHELSCSEREGNPSCSDSSTHCSCRCAGENDDDPGPFCACPDEYECKPILTSYTASPETRGSYCAPTDKRSVPGD